MNRSALRLAGRFIGLFFAFYLLIYIFPFPVDALPLSLLERGATRVAHRTGRHPRHARRRGRACRADARRGVRGDLDAIGAKLGAGHLEDHAADALTHLGRSAMDERAPVPAQLDAC